MYNNIQAGIWILLNVSYVILYTANFIFISPFVIIIYFLSGHYRMFDDNFTFYIIILKHLSEP